MNCRCSFHDGFLTVRGYAERAQQLSLEGLASRDENGYLDKSGSVSALVEVEDDAEYDPNHVELNQRLIYNGT